MKPSSRMRGQCMLCHIRIQAKNLLLLVYPAELGTLPLHKLLWLEPQSDLLFRAFNSIRAVADITADIDGKVTTDGARSGGEWVGGTEDNTAGLDDVAALPDHGGDWAGVHVCVIERSV
jgi:hypothetical protein